ncbi:MAG TPA: riboflavin synthase [Myxococcota bacterium]|nr:riboflavin synthase [Myxococcota bacterium]
MFTGIVEECGAIRTVARRAEGLALLISAPRTSAGMKPGDSVAVDGVCLTAERVEDGALAVVAAAETLAVTTLGDVAPGRRVHLELALRLGDRLGGHLVQGHVDGVGRVSRRGEAGGSPLLEIDAPAAVARYVIAKGSIAVDGVSLTVNRVEGSRFEVLLIPHTVAVTHLGDRRTGDRVNLEVDLLAKYVEKLLGNGGVATITAGAAGASGAAGGAATGAGGLTLEKLKAQGYIPGVE